MKPGTATDLSAIIPTEIDDDQIGIARRHIRWCLLRHRAAGAFHKEDLSTWEDLSRLARVCQGIKILHEREEEIAAMVKLACEGDTHMRMVLRRAATWHLLSGEAIPPILGAFLVSCLERPEARKRGRPRSDSIGRDWAIAQTVYDARGHGLHPTRNRASDHPSVCSLVADELRRMGFRKMSERNVETIWGAMRAQIVHEHELT